MNVVIVGGGKKMDFLVRSLLKKKYKITIINESEKKCKYLAHEYDVQVILGNATKTFILEDADVINADLIIALTPKDADNLIICQLAKKQFGVKRVFATVTNPNNVAIFKKLGVDAVINAAYTMAGMIEHMASFDEVVQSLSIEDGKIELIEISISSEHSICGKELLNVNLPNDTIIGCIIRKEKAFVPNGNTTVECGDKLAILTSSDLKDEILNAIVGSLKK